jgi:hypothetical protein
MTGYLPHGEYKSTNTVIGPRNDLIGVSKGNSEEKLTINTITTNLSVNWRSTTQYDTYERTIVRITGTTEPAAARRSRDTSRRVCLTFKTLFLTTPTLCRVG